jgi:hypothetical protein
MNSESVLMPRDLKEMAMKVMADRRMQGWTQDEMLELRDWMREAFQANSADLRAYLVRECAPIDARAAMVLGAIERIKARIEKERIEAA